MIGKIRKGKNFAGLGRYLYGTGKHHEAHVNPRAVAHGQVLVDPDPKRQTWRDWVADMEFAARTRPDVEKPVWHCSLRAAPEDRRLSDAEWGRIAHKHVERMGLAEHPWVAVRHGEDHVHIVASRVDGEGRLWSSTGDYFRSMTSVREIEREHGLAVVTKERETGRLATTTASERARAERLGREPERVQLREAMHAAREGARGNGVAGWESELQRRGVLFQRQMTRDGKVTGYRVSREGWTDQGGAPVWLKASQVDRKLSWSKVGPELGAENWRDPARLAAVAFPQQPRPREAGSAEQRAQATLDRLRAQRERQRDDHERGRGR